MRSDICNFSWQNSVSALQNTSVVGLHCYLFWGGEGDNRGWDGWMASLTRWTWVWVNSGSWWWTGRPGVLWFMGSQRVGHNSATEQNWTEYILFQVLSIIGCYKMLDLAPCACMSLFFSGSWWWTGRPGVLRFVGSQRVGHDWVTELNWTEYVSRER